MIISLGGQNYGYLKTSLELISLHNILSNIISLIKHMPVSTQYDLIQVKPKREKH